MAWHGIFLLWWRERVERIKAFKRLDELKLGPAWRFGEIWGLSRLFDEKGTFS